MMRRIFEAVNAQLDEKGMILRRGTVVDATLVQAQARRPRYDDEGDEAKSRRSSSPTDPDADWGRSTFGYKGHLAIDRGSWLVRDALVTPANVGDTDMFDALVQGDEDVMYADAAYESRKRTRRLEEMGIGNAVMHRANKHHPVLADDKRTRNAEISKKRMPAEGVFGYFKRTLGYRKVRYTGLAKGETELLLKSMAYNIVRSVGLSDRPARA